MNTVVQLKPQPVVAGHSTAEDVLAVADRLAKRLATTAVQRDRTGGHAAAEREWIRDSTLLTLTIPRAHGGQGGGWSVFYRTVRRLAEADSALAHVYAFHHLQLATVQLYGTPGQQARLLAGTAANRWFWGNALNPLDKRLLATQVAGGYRLDGVKGFASGSVGADQLVVSAWVPGEQSLMVGVVPTSRAGVRVQADWDAFGQRQTDSGNVSFDGVHLATADVLQAPGAVPTPQGTLRSQLAQLILTNLYVGIAQGAFDAARAYTRDHTRPWFSAGVALSVDDPIVQHRYGDLWLKVRPAAALADHAALLVDEAFRRGDALTATDRAGVALAVSEAKVLAHRAAIEVSSQLFELTGARSTSESLGLDRFWRNARVHTLHDPVDQKLRALGRHALTGEPPEPTAYS